MPDSYRHGRSGLVHPSDTHISTARPQCRSGTRLDERWEKWGPLDATRTQKNGVLGNGKK
jgi:hypothetical protein